MDTMERALVFGGSGYLGSAVVEALAARGLPVDFSYHENRERASALEQLDGVHGHRVDLQDGGAIRTLIEQLQADEQLPNLFFHCAGVGAWRTIAELEDAEFDEAIAVNLRAAFIACRELSTRLVAAERAGSFVMVTAMTGTQSVPAPVHFGASQAALIGLVRALSKELGPHKIRVNAVTLGILKGGISLDIAPATKEKFEHFSALGRRGEAEEAARLIVKVARSTPTMTGAILSANGGL